MNDKIFAYLIYGMVLFCLSAVGVVTLNKIYEMFGIESDNPVEEAVENFLEERLDLPEDSIDLTPEPSAAEPLAETVA